MLTWHEPPDPPPGIPNGASGVCVTADGGVVLVSDDGVTWGLPGGRPEPGETWLDVLHREMLEEACATVVSARLLGFSRGECVAGHELGRVIVRSVWRADVDLGPWLPRFEILHRRVVAPHEVMDVIGADHPFASLTLRQLYEARLATRRAGGRRPPLA